MEREEAIQELRNCKGLIQQDGQDYLDERDIPLLDMAIEALQAEPNCHKCAIKELWEETEKEDLVSVVRCKDCIHYEKHDTWSACTYWSGDPYEQASVIDDDFCSYGERREP